MIDVNPKPKAVRPQKPSEALNALIEAGLQRRRDRQPPRNYVGMSELGDNCLRRVYYNAVKAPRKEFSARQLRAFEVGHLYEALTAEWLREAGFTLLSQDGHGAQFRVYQADGRLSGGIDGVLTAGPEAFNRLITYPALWENKALAAKWWKEIVRHGLQDAEPKYFGQVNVYMGYFQLQQCLFTAENKDTGEIYCEILPYSLQAAQAASDRGVEVIQAIESGTEPRRLCPTKAYFEVNMCSFADHCFREG